MSAAIRVLGLGTASPPFVLPQGEAQALAERAAGAEGLSASLRGVFANAGIDERQLGAPPSFFEESHSFPEKNQLACETALSLSTSAAREALQRAAIAPDDIAAVLFVCSTAIATPSLDASLVESLGLPPEVCRLPLWGLGCAGGSAGLGRAFHLARALGRPVLLVSVEVCSATFCRGDRRPSSVVATALFGDGAAAVVVGAGTDGPEILAQTSHLYPDSREVMGWKLCDEGLSVRFAKSIPVIVQKTARDFVAQAASAVSVEPTSLRRFVLHPGGIKVLAAYQEALNVSSEALASSYRVLRRHGNMSGPTVLFALQDWLSHEPPTGELALLAALGPGFAAEGVVLRW